MGNKLEKAPATIKVREDVLYKILSELNCKKSKVCNDIYKILGFTPEQIKEYLINKGLDAYIGDKTSYHLLDYDITLDKRKQREFLRSFKAFSSFDGNNNEGTNLFEDGDVILSKIKKNPIKYINYIGWISRKMLIEIPNKDKFKLLKLKSELNEEEIDSIFKTYEFVETRAQTCLNQSIAHVQSFLSKIEKYTGVDEVKSEEFETIHSVGEKRMTIKDLIEKYIYYENEKRSLEKKGNLSDNYYNLIKAQFEIQRLLGFSLLYTNSKLNHEQNNLKADEEYLINRLLKFFHNDDIEIDEKDNLPRTREILYKYTKTKKLYYRRLEDGKYEYDYDKPKSGDYKSQNVNTTNFKGKTNEYKENTIKNIPIRHVSLRLEKDNPALVNKFVRKKHSSFNEILDQKGIIIVIDSFKNAYSIADILANKLGTDETSWIESIEFIDKSGNKQSSKDYNCMKGILNVAFPGKKYNIKLEVQIFDTENYIKAELDKDSPANHENYKLFQDILELLPKYFPKEIYPESITSIVKNVLENKIDLEGNF